VTANPEIRDLMTTPARSGPDAAALLAALIQCRSVTPEEGGALTLLERLLKDAGFAVERLTFSAPDTPDVQNLFATIGAGSPHLVFNGHVDVVPPGDEGRWTHPPFGAEVVNGIMYGRGAVDMKGGVASFVAAALDHLAAHGKPKGTLSLMFTGDEEGPAINGSVKLVDWAVRQGHRFDAALVGEPTSVKTLGDTIKTGRRGSLSFVLKVTGKQGHVAFPHQADNPITTLVKLLDRLIAIRFDDANEDFLASNLEITSVDVGNPVVNIIPSTATARFNVRFNNNWSMKTMEAKVRAALDTVGRPYDLAIVGLAAEPFLSRSAVILEPLIAAIRDTTGITPEFSTGGGTSDARFLKDHCPVVEFGLVGDTLHQVDERVPVVDLERLTVIYRHFLEGFFGHAKP
jgi:succinyl-diaminopimelate desuccinylase